MRDISGMGIARIWRMTHAIVPGAGLDWNQQKAGKMPSRLGTRFAKRT
jgi:hypothetical protein